MRRRRKAEHEGRRSRGVRSSSVRVGSAQSQRWLVMYQICHLKLETRELVSGLSNQKSIFRSIQCRLTRNNLPCNQGVDRSSLSRHFWLYIDTPQRSDLSATSSTPMQPTIHTPELRAAIDAMKAAKEKWAAPGVNFKQDHEAYVARLTSVASLIAEVKRSDSSE